METENQTCFGDGIGSDGERNEIENGKINNYNGDDDEHHNDSDEYDNGTDIGDDDNVTISSNVTTDQKNNFCE